MSMNVFPTVGAVYDRPQFRRLHSSKLWAVIDRPYSCSIQILSLFLILSIPALAHHSFDSEYDSSRIVTLTGEVVGFDWNNPHSSIHLVVRRDGKLQEL